MKNILIPAVLLIAGYAAQSPAIELDASPAMRTITDRLISEGIYTRNELKALLGPIEIDNGVLELFKRQAEAKPWHEYRNIFLKRDRISAGKEFMQSNRELLEAVYDKYGVPPEVVTALIGVETFYGTRMGSRNVLRSLATLTAAYPRREKFFGNELETFLGLLKTENLVASDMEGSYAGAVGIPQFMPTSYVAYAVDFNGNGKRDLVREVEDAAGSVANYLVVHGWKRGAPISKWLDQPINQQAKKLVGKRAKPKHSVLTMRQNGISLNESDDTRVSLNRLEGGNGSLYFVGYGNFYALTRYNPSNKYAMAIVELSQEIAKQ
ncbi:MAG: lytic murein transglycosylase B [Proteobacteria bacterium]|nr:lytic murein transglycosylase B [Pseudomonadota bacterium]